ncbi:MAG: valine--tRNA ligase [Candidatus Neomarinimicrobiota bacterium]
MQKSHLEKIYNSSLVEDKWYDHWLSKNYFSADSQSNKEPYTIIIPPPNVTGILTVGHVLNNTIQDILIRKARMEGKEACWVPGTDHASIATESKVVAMLEEKGIKKNQLTREQFLNHAWEWKEKYGGIIINQLKKLGCSCDWEKERFTMDDDYTNSVLSAFVKLYDKGLIYKGHRLVNWCPVSKSAISDEEVIYQEKNGFLWYLRYSITSADEFIVVATTRPETMLGDTAVAVHPDDERYQKFIGQSITLPLVERKIPIIADEFVDPNFGTGCVKVTPAHDPNDFAMGERHRLEFINIMNDDATLNSNVPKKYEGLSREDARKNVVRDLDSLGLIHKTEDYVNKVGYSERGHVPIEFYMSDQWFMKMSDLAKPAMDAVKDGTISFHPQHWTKTYDHWMNNIKDWCISRQLWWGHQIPVWYHNDDKGKIHVSVQGPDDPENWTQDKDVLDTWASSWLWPIGVHSWPIDGSELKKFYPTETLVTGPDIIFFWVARMIMTGYEFMGEHPFKDVYFTSILRDETGKKLSKSLGNSPDPIELFNEYGTDAVRFGIMLMAPQGLDVLFSKDRLEVGRNFMNKLWNVCRFIQMNIDSNSKFNNIETGDKGFDLSDKWILSRLSKMVTNYNNQLDRFHFNEAAKVLYDFTWNDFCDWYVEIAKTRFYGSDDSQSNIARSISLKCIRTVLTLLHPFSPFITEELWTHFKLEDSCDLIISPWIDKEGLTDEFAEEGMNILKDFIISIRSIRSRMNVPPSKHSDLFVRCNKEKKKFLHHNINLVKTLARVKNISMGENIEKPSKSATAICSGMELYIPLGGLVDLDEEKKRMLKRIAEINRLLTSINGKLSNSNFMQRAPKMVIDKEQSNLDNLNEELEKITINLEILE